MEQNNPKFALHYISIIADDYYYQIAKDINQHTLS